MSARATAAIIFDLDGTLIDSLSGIEASLRFAAAECNITRAVPPLRPIVGPPIAKMIDRIWPDLRESERGRVLAAFRRHYDYEGCLMSPLFPTVLPTLAALKASGVELFVLTNKPTKPTQRILEHLQVTHFFSASVSPDTNNPAFPAKSAGAKWLRDEQKLDAAKTLLVGDGLDDAQAAAECGFGFIAAGYGYGVAARQADLPRVAILETFSELREIVLYQ